MYGFPHICMITRVDWKNMKLLFSASYFVYDLQGGSASPFDRNMGTKFGMKAAHFLIKMCMKYHNPNTGVYLPIIPY